MRATSFVVAITTIVLGLTPAFGQQVPESLTTGKDLPGAFHPFNVTDPRDQHYWFGVPDLHKDRFHCLISEHGLDPMVLVFTRDTAFSDPLKELLRRLDAAVKLNPSVRLKAVVVFLSDTVKDVVIEDNAREALSTKIEKLAEELGLEHVVLCLDSEKHLGHYQLPDAEKTKVKTVVLIHHRYVILGSEAIVELTADKVKAIREDLALKVGARRQ